MTVLAADLPQDDPSNHRNHTVQPDFYPSDLEDVDCKQDCLMFKDVVGADTLTDEQIDGLEQCDFSKHLPSVDSDVEVARAHTPVDFLGENVIKRETERINGDLGGSTLGGSRQKTVHNGDISCDNDSDRVRRDGDGRAAECETVIDGRVSGDIGPFLDERSVETSTETLVSEHLCR